MKAYGRKPVPVPPASGPMNSAHMPIAFTPRLQILHQRRRLVVVPVEDVLVRDDVFVEVRLRPSGASP